MKLPKYSPNTIKMKQQLYLLSILFLSLTACKTTAPVVPNALEDEVTFKFIQVNDVYEIAPLSGGKYGGMARVAHVVDSVKAVEPSTYLFLAGDFLNPSLLGALKVNGERVRGRQMIEIMNAMRFDLVTFGNHEFDISEEDLQKRLNESTFPWVTANVKQVTEDGPKPFVVEGSFAPVPIPETHVITVSNKAGKLVKLGFVSVTLPSNPQDYVFYEDIYEAAQRAYSELEKTSDVVFGFTHLALEQDREVARLLPKLPLIMGGHEHNNMLVPTKNGVIAKADANAKTIYIHTITYNTKTKDVAVDSHLMPIDDTVASNSVVQQITDKWQDILNSSIKQVIENPNEVIHYATTPLDGTDSANRGIQTNLGDIFTAAMVRSFDVPAEVAVLNGGSMRLDDMLDGQVTSIDIFRVLPFGGSVLRVDMTGKLLKQVLDYGKDAGGTGAYLQRHNISESPNGGWLVEGNPIDDAKTYVVATSDFLMKGYDIPFLTPENPGVLKVYEPKSTESAHDIRKAVILYLKSLKK